MKNNTKSTHRFPVKRYTSALLIGWTIIILLSLFLNISEETEQVIGYARIHAASHFDKDLLYRRWNAGHGGVYVPVTEETPPNPYLKDVVPERDITTLSGKGLTLINPAYMTRQVHELEMAEDGVLGHITSLKPIRPENAADQWETAALMAFELGEKEAGSIEMMNGKEYFRFMKPLVTEKQCLKCHEKQGYKEGDIRGGISVSVPMAEHNALLADHKDTYYIEYSLMWLFGAVFIILGSIRISRNDRKRQNAENEIIRAAAEWRSTFDSISDLVSVHDTEFRILRANRALADFLKTEPEELIGKHCYEVVHGLDAPFPGCPHKEMLKTGKAETKEIFNTKYGLNLIITVSPIFKNGKLKGSVHFIKDITERIKSERALRESEDKYRTLFEKSADAILIIEGDKFVDCNSATVKMLDYKDKKELLETHPSQLSPPIQPDGRSSFEKADEMMSIAYEQGSNRFEWNHKRQNGEIFPVEVLLTAVLVGGKRFLHVVWRDITERKRAEDEREYLNRELMQKNREFEQMLYISSHDLRTPLVNITGYSGELKKELAILLSKVKSGESSYRFDDRERRILEDMPISLEYISSSALKMNALLDGLLQYSRIGRIGLRKEKLDMNSLISETIKTFRFKLDELGVRLDISELPESIGDGEKLGQVFSNLIGNSLKYMDQKRKGFIKISGVIEAGMNVYCVEDNGIGISADYKEKIFDIFHQLEPSITGEGLGLTIVRKIVERHGGRVWVESELGRGSRFCFALPLKQN